MERIRGFCSRNRRYLWSGLIVLYVGFIFHNSLTPAVVSSRQSGSVLAMLQSVLRLMGQDGTWLTEHIVRKTAHFAEYTVLGVLLWNALRSYLLPRSLWMAVQAWLTVLLPLTDETFQLITEGRSGQVDDVWLDIAGVCFGTVCMIALWKLAAARRERRSGSAP